MTKHWKTVPAAVAQKDPLYGVAGWLLVFSISLALGLVSDIGRLKGEAYSVGLSLGEFFNIDHPAVSYAKFVLGSHTLMVAVIYWFLLSKHPSFRNAASILIALTLPVQVLIATIFPFSGVGSVLAQQGIIWVLSCAVWITYLQRSRRVRVTFENRIDIDTPVVSVSNDQGPVVIPESSQRSDSHRAYVEVNSSISQYINQTGTPSENFWTVAYEELESASRRPGLWARSFSEAGGDETIAKAKYLRHRANELEGVYLEQAGRLQVHKDSLQKSGEVQKSIYESLIFLQKNPNKYLQGILRLIPLLGGRAVWTQAGIFRMEWVIDFKGSQYKFSSDDLLVAWASEIVISAAKLELPSGLLLD